MKSSGEMDNKSGLPNSFDESGAHLATTCHENVGIMAHFFVPIKVLHDPPQP